MFYYHIQVHYNYSKFIYPINLAPAIATPIPNSADIAIIGIIAFLSFVKTMNIVGIIASSPIINPFNQGSIFQLTNGIIKPKTTQ